MKNCCNHKKKDKQCIRKSDKKTFKLPRRFSKKKCCKPKGFTMRSSCAPYKDCFKKTKKKQKGGKKKKIKKQFLYNPNNPKKSFDVYIDKNPKDTIPIKYKTLQDVKNTIKKLERLYKTNKYPHTRIWKVGMILKVRLEALKDKKPQHFKLANRYLKFLGKRTKLKTDKERKNIKFR
jgi:hypothetical protein